MSASLVVEMREISKGFPGTQAVDSVDLLLERGEVLGLIGANGAGKSTIVNILAGVLRPDSGTIKIDGEQVDFRNPRDAQRQGISFVQQEIATFATLSVVDNIFMTNFPTSGPLIKRAQMRKRAQEILDHLGCDFGIDDVVESLSTGDRQMVTIARALMSSPSVIILDEPTSSLSVTEKNRLFSVLENLKEQGVSFIFISHFLSEVFSICDRIMVMRNGQLAGTDHTSNLETDQAVEWMVGNASSAAQASTQNKALGEVVLEVENLDIEGALSQVSFSARRGEVVGIWGLMGSGRTELARALVGLDSLGKGRIAIHDGTALRPQSASRRKKLCGYVPEDRRQEGLFLPMSVQRNISMIGLKAISSWGLLVTKREVSLAEKFIERLGIKVSHRSQRVGTLSGGNQQKVVLARWVAVGPPIYILDEPMRGLDIGAKAQIRELIAELADSGAAIVVIDSELSELKLVADRYVVLRRGEVVGQLEGDADELTLMSLAAGAKESQS